MSAEVPILDQNTLAELQDLDPGNEEGLMDELLNGFVHDSKRHLAGLQAALSAGNLTELHRIAHTLKGSSRAIGALRLGNACEAVERVDGAGKGPMVVRIADELSSVWVAIGEWLAGGEPRAL